MRWPDNQRNYAESPSHFFLALHVKLSQLVSLPKR